MKLKSAAILLGGLMFGILLGGLVLWGGSSNSSTGTRRLPPTVGSPVPKFTLDYLKGEAFDLSAKQGKPVVINFWATWCPPCKEEMPLLERYGQRFRDEFTLVGVNYMESKEVVGKYVNDNEITFDIVIDKAGIVSDLYYVRNYPTTFFIDEQGILRGLHLGLLTEDLLVKYLKTIGVEP